MFEEGNIANGKVNGLHIANRQPRSLSDDSNPAFGGLASENHVEQSGEITNID